MIERRAAMKHYPPALDDDVEPGSGPQSSDVEPKVVREPDPIAPLAEDADSPLALDPGAPVVAILNHDDELARSVAEAFEAEGWRSAIGRVPAALDGLAEALAFLEESNPDVVVFDLVQPFGAYLETLRALRREGPGRARPFVLTTSNKVALAKEGIAKAIELREPEDLAELTIAVRRAMSSGH